MALTAKKKKFAHGLIMGMSNREAAIYAGYSEKSASTKGAMLSKDPEILEYLAKVKSAQPEEPEVQVGDEKVKQVVIPEVITRVDILNAQNMEDPLAFLVSVFSNPDVDGKLRVEAAKAALPYKHGKVAPMGKKEGKTESAKTAAQAGGKFGTLDAQMGSRPS